MSIRYITNLGWTYVFLGVLTLALMLIADTPWYITASITGWIVGLGAMQVILAKLSVRRLNQRLDTLEDRIRPDVDRAVAERRLPEHDDDQDTDLDITIDHPWAVRPRH